MIRNTGLGKGFTKNVKLSVGFEGYVEAHKVCSRGIHICDGASKSGEQ